MIGIDLCCVINIQIFLPLHHITEQTWRVFVCVVLSRMSGGLLSCCCCSFMSVTGIIDTPTHRQAGRQTDRKSGGRAVHMLLLILSLGIHSTLAVSRSKLWAVCVCASMCVCIFIVTIPSMKMIEYSFPNSVSFGCIQLCNYSYFISLLCMSVFCSNLSSSSLSPGYRRYSLGLMKP